MGGQSKFLLFFLFLFGSCAKIPQQQLEEIPPVMSLSHSIEKALQSKSFEKGEWPNERWWELFENPQLTSLIEEGLKNNPDIKMAQSKVEESLQTAKQIRALLFPHINFFAQDNWQHLSKHGFEREFAFHSPPASQVPPGFNQINWTAFATPVPAILQAIDLGFGMSWELDFFGKNRHKLSAAMGEAKATEAENNQTRLAISVQIANNFFSLQTQAAFLQIYRRMVDLRKHASYLIDLKNKTGLTTRLSAIAAEIDLSRAEKLVLDLEETASIDRHRLLTLIGVNPDKGLDISSFFTPLDAPLAIPEKISSDLLVRRPDLMAAIWRVEKEASEIGAAKAEFYPEINLAGLLSFKSVVPDELFSLSSAANSLLPSFKLPIFKGGLLRSNLREKIASFEEAVYAYQQTLLHALQEVADALIQLDLTRKKIEEYKKICKASLERMFLVQKQHEIGTADYSAILELELEELSQQSTLLSLQSDQILYTVKLIKALGGGYQSCELPSEKFLREEECQ